jgi:septum site-determining protein MinC
LNNSSIAPLDIKFSKIKAVTFTLQPRAQEEALDALKKRLGSSPSIYSSEAAVLDFSAWSEAELVEYGVNLDSYVEMMRAAGVHLVEIRGHSTLLESQSEDLGLRYEPGQIETIENPTPAELSPAIEVPAIPQFDDHRRSMIIDQSVRSGQKIYAQGADLIVMGQVSAGAEVIADGNVHVYGLLRGRALAGAAGDTQSRIMTTCFEAELVAVAGYYLTFEGGFPEEIRSKPTLIHLDQGIDPAILRLKAINIR